MGICVLSNVDCALRQAQGPHLFRQGDSIQGVVHPDFGLQRKGLGGFGKKHGGLFKVSGKEIGLCHIKVYAVSYALAYVGSVELVQKNYGFLVFFLNKGCL